MAQRSARSIGTLLLLVAALVATTSPAVASAAAARERRALDAAAQLDLGARRALLERLALDPDATAALRAALDAGSADEFDRQLLQLTRHRAAGAFYFTPADVEPYLKFVRETIGGDDIIARADTILANRYPEQDGASESTVEVPDDVDWHHTAYSDNPETVHTLNRHRHWVYLAIAYRMTGDARYGRKIVDQLTDWSAQNPPLEDPESWRRRLPQWWLMDAAVRADTWQWTYALIGTTELWTPRVNTLFLYKVCQHGEFLSVVTPQDLRTNHALVHGQGLLTLARFWPEFRDAVEWERRGRDLLFRSMDAQTFADGCNGEQSPNYAVVVVTRLLEMYWLDRRGGAEWPAERVELLRRAVDAYHQLLSPDGNNAALSDSYRSSASTIFLEANIVIGAGAGARPQRWPSARPRQRDVWLFGPRAVEPYLNHPVNPLPEPRGRAFALPASGNYILRSGDDPQARQIIFDAGPKGGLHGHFDLLNFELFGYGRPLIADPGLFRYDASDDRLWVQGTPAHNTISVDGVNHGALEGAGNPGLVVDQWHVADDHAQVTAHHFAYGDLPGRPVLARSIWYDFDGTMLVVDWAEAVEPHAYDVSFTIPGTAFEADAARGRIRSTNESGGNVLVQGLLRPGQAARREARFTSSRPPPRHRADAQRFVIAQSGEFAVFATLVVAHEGTSPPDVSAEWVTADPKPGEPVVLRLRRSGDDAAPREITFTPPELQRLDAQATTNAQACDVAFDASGRLHLAYFDNETRTLKYTVRGANGRWSVVETIDASSGCGYHLSLALDSDGRPGVAYADAQNGDLKYAYYDAVASAWQVQTVDADGTSGFYPSLAYSRRDGAVISYYDKTRGALRLASSVTGGWKLETVDAGEDDADDVGRFSRLALDPAREDASKLAILYEDTTRQRYRYAVHGRVRGGEVRGAFSFFDVRAGVSKLGGGTALAFDPQGRPAAVLYDARHRRVLYAASAGDTFAVVKFDNATVANQVTEAHPVALLFDSDGSANVFYFDAVRECAVRARSSDGVNWSRQDLGPGGRQLHVARRGDAIAYTSGDARGYVRVFDADLAPKKE